MRSLVLRVALSAFTAWLLSFGLFAWRWPARWRLPVRPGGTVNQAPDNPRRADLAEPAGGGLEGGLIIALVTLVVLIVVLAVVLL